MQKNVYYLIWVLFAPVCVSLYPSLPALHVSEKNMYLSGYVWNFSKEYAANKKTCVSFPDAFSMKSHLETFEGGHKVSDDLLHSIQNSTLTLKKLNSIIKKTCPTIKAATIMAYLLNLQYADLRRTILEGICYE